MFWIEQTRRLSRVAGNLAGYLLSCLTNLMAMSVARKATRTKMDRKPVWTHLLYLCRW